VKTLEDPRRPGAPRREAGQARQPAKERPLLTGDWVGALFLHYEVPPEILQPHLPFALDLWEGRAFVSWVAFTMQGMRPARGGRLVRWLFAPVAEQRFLNLRTYVREDGEQGICFLAEWLSHWGCVHLGPALYGLPYRGARLQYEHAADGGVLRGRVVAWDGDGEFAYAARTEESVDDVPFRKCHPGSVDEFLLERYSAFTWRGRTKRCFRVWHAPWQQARVRVEWCEEGLAAGFAPWWSSARFVGANYSPGVSEVGMGRSRRVRGGSDVWRNPLTA
jgi:uncharacterized protein YqjF (DUF2071 family)